jgi:glyoxylase I family protein
MTAATEAVPATRTMPRVAGLHHLGITVRDIDASEAWYTQVLGLVRLYVEPHATGGGYAVVMTRPGTGLFLGLDYHPAADGEMFRAQRTGLDHLALTLPARQDLEDWIIHLEASGVVHSEVVESAEPAPHALLVFHDLDGIPIELFWFGG